MRQSEGASALCDEDRKGVDDDDRGYSQGDHGKGSHEGRHGGESLGGLVGLIGSLVVGGADRCCGADNLRNLLRDLRGRAVRVYVHGIGTGMTADASQIGGR